MLVKKISLMSEKGVDPEQLNESHPIVGIGASAGGVEALQHFFAHLPESTGMAFVVILHLLREKESTLADLIQQHVSMPVQQVTERVVVKPDHVYVIPPDSDLSMTNGYLSLTQRKDSATRHAPVDLFFRTLAQTHGANTVGIILSGSGSDGTLGLKAIKEAGGLALVQDPDEAAYAGMPRSAIATGLVDRVLQAREMAEKLVEYQQQAQRIQLPDEPEDLPDDTTATLLKILTQLRSRIGHDFSHYKRATLLRRIARRMQINQIETLPAYLTFLREHADETKALFKNLLISDTNFFRDPDAFAALEQVIPNLFEGKSRSDQVRVWVPGCATGEEAYSLAILLAEHADTLDDPPKIQIFATDIDEEALTTARTGTYPTAIAADVSEERLKRFFTRDGDAYRIRKDLHENILFATHNLLGDPPFSKLDLIACRNVLIYLMRDIHERAFELFHYALRPDGYLLLGTAESAADLDLFEAIDKHQRLYQRQNVPSLPPRLPEMPLLHPNDGQQRQRRTPERQPLAGDMHRRLLEQYAPPSVLVNSHYNIVHLSETAGRYLEMTGGEPTMNVLKVVRHELQGPLHTTLYQALHDGRATVERGIQVRFNGDVGLVDLIVRPTGGDDGFALVLFSEIALTEDRLEDTPQEDPALRHLSAELQRTKERLQATVEEFDSSREEMKAQNEELQSVNEEYKTTTEELETSKEELQSVNEELQTVNQELKNKVDELDQAHSDLQNLMAATEIATLFLDRDLRIKRYTPRTTELFNIVPGDRGRPLVHITHHLDYDDLVPDARQVLRTLVPIEKEVQSTGGQWFYATLRPYRTVDDKIEGIIITLVDFTRRHEAEENVRRGEEQYSLVIHNIREYAIFTTDETGHIATWNAEAEKVLGWREDEILGQPIATIFTEEDRTAGVPAQEMETARQHDRASDDRWHLRKEGSRFWANGVLSAMYDHEGTLRGFVKILRDNTARKKAEEKLRRVTEQAERQVQSFQTTLSAITDFVYVFDQDGRFLWANQALLDLWGIPLEEAIGKNTYDLQYPVDLADRIQRQVKQVLTTGRTVKDETPYISPTGQTGYYEYIFTPIFDQNGEVEAVAGTARDIAERKASEVALQETKERFQAVAETVPDILFYTDAEINVEYLNPRWTEFTGITLEAGFGPS